VKGAEHFSVEVMCSAKRLLLWYGYEHAYPTWVQKWWL